MGAGGSERIISLCERSQSAKSFGFLGFELVCGLAKNMVFGLSSQPRRSRSTVGSWVRVKLEYSAVWLLANEPCSGEASQDRAARENSVRKQFCQPGVRETRTASSLRGVPLPPFSPPFYSSPPPLCSSSEPLPISRSLSYYDGARGRFRSSSPFLTVHGWLASPSPTRPLHFI